MTFVRAGLVAAAAFVLAGCASENYIFTPPKSAKGIACAERCQTRQEECRAAAEDRADRSQTTCDHDAQTDYDACMRYSQDRSKCVKRGCYEYAHTAECVTDYRACYQTCGGKVTREKDK
jgi:hypothetical protein